jgi:RNA polymerase sigma-70 factor (ECF subfamily)
MLPISSSSMSGTPVASAEQPSRRKTSAPDGAAAERQLARWIAEGDDEAVAELFDILGGTLYALALGIVEDTARADAAVEETFAELWEKRASLGRLPALSPWLTEHCRARALALKNGTRIPAAVTLREAVAPVPLATRLLRCPSQLRSSRVNLALERLSPPEREALVLGARAGLSLAEIARRLGLRPGEVSALLRSGLRSFRGELDRTLRRDPA